MPDDQTLSKSAEIDEIVSGPSGAKNAGISVRTQNFLSPAIYELTSEQALDPASPIAKAAAMGFNSILSPVITNEIAHAAFSAGLKIFYSISLSYIDDQAVITKYPDWFVNSPSGAKFVYLSETDAAVSWWDVQISQLMGRGVTSFFCRDVADVPASIWRHIIDHAHNINPEAVFVASTLDMTPEQINGLVDCGFNFSLSSSCWWDFSASWLNDETDRLTRLASPIALTAPPKTEFPTSSHIRRRALALAATFGAGWLMQGGYETAEDDDLSVYVTGLNSLRISEPTLQTSPPAKIASSAGSKVALLVRGQKFLLAANVSSIASEKFSPMGQISGLCDSGASLLAADDNRKLAPGESVILPPAGTRLYKIKAETPITTLGTLMPDCDAPRIGIEEIAPKVDSGNYPVRRIVGDFLTIEADLISDGHDKLAAEILFRPMDETSWQSSPMHLISNDRWRGKIQLPRLGRYTYVVKAWKDNYATFADELYKKHNAGVDTHLEIAEGTDLIKRTATANTNEAGAALSALVKKLSDAADDIQRVDLLSEQTATLMRAGDLKSFAVQSNEIIVDAERHGAGFSNWYEIFPRSQSGDANRHGNFYDVIEQLPRIAEMGFDVLYFPPIHPIGRVNRKGRNNSLTPGETDPGSPYAIGNEHGGHASIHPELGTIEDFRSLINAAAKYGIELALDFAIQCAPDHPWLKEHKDWFDWRPDGSLRYAENPPKKYEDIVNVDFYTAGAKPSLWIALRDVVQFWVDQGVKIFRVDNPHTKPLPFWEWLIGDIRGRHPEVVFLAEAFTRPKVMYRLAKIGFSQSYTYFTWRNTKAELQDYLKELNITAPKEYFRPHFFVNTPDINPSFLHNSGRPGFLIRAALAATLSGLWGVYNGFELCEAASMPGKEEYLDSEKYQIRVWDYDAPGNIVAEITQLNKIRRANAALHSHLGIEFHNAYDDQVLFFSKTAVDGNIILAAISLDPFNTHETTIELPLWHFGLPDDGALRAEDLMREHQFTWYGKYQPVTLHPEQPFCIWRVQKLSN